MDHDVDLEPLIDSPGASYNLILGDTPRPLHNVRITKTDNPVRGPTARGNAYVEQKRSYRMSADTNRSIEARLRGTMLGPSAEFGGITVAARAASARYTIQGSLLSMVRTKDSITIHVSITDIRPS